MPGFANQFDQLDPFSIVVPGGFQNWALRAAGGAVAMLFGCSSEQLSTWGRAIEDQLQQRASLQVGSSSPHAAEAGRILTSPAEVRWQLTDLQLLGSLDLTEPPEDLCLTDPLTGSTQPVQLWRLRATLALWKLADAADVLNRASNKRGAVRLCLVDGYAGLDLPHKVNRDVAAELASSLITEATAAVALAWEGYRAELMAGQSAWAEIIAAEIGKEQGAETRKSLEAAKRSDGAREAGRARQAETYRAQALVFAWLRKKAPGHFANPTGATAAAIEYLRKRRFRPALKKKTWGDKPVFKWLTELAPTELHSRWRAYNPRGKASKGSAEQE